MSGSGDNNKVSGTIKTPADFLKSIRGRPVVVKLNSGVDYRGDCTLGYKSCLSCTLGYKSCLSCTLGYKSCLRHSCVSCLGSSCGAVSEPDVYGVQGNITLHLDDLCVQSFAEPATPWQIRK
ncbi:hypothetical protein Bca101_053102 [Brassica carinata]